MRTILIDDTLIYICLRNVIRIETVLEIIHSCKSLLNIFE